MVFSVREAKPEDFESLEQILINNNMLQFPEIDGKDAMKRVYERMGRYFLVAETETEVIGLIRGVYDGSRALIHQMAVARNYQKQGVGKKLLYELSLRFEKDGAATVSITSTNESKSYYQKHGFEEIPIILMLNRNISSLTG